MRTKSNPVILAGFTLIVVFWNLKLHKPIGNIFSEVILIYAIGALAVIIGFILEKRQAKISTISLFIIVIPITISWIMNTRLGYENTYFNELCYAIVCIISVKYINEKHLTNITIIIYYSIGLLSIVLFFSPSYYVYFDVNAFERPTFSAIRAGGPMLSSNEMPLAMIVLYLAIAHLKKDNVLMFIILLITVAISQSKAAAIILFACLFCNSALSVENKLKIIITITITSYITFGSQIDEIINASRFSLKSEDSQESTALRGEAIKSTFYQLQASPLPPSIFEYKYPVTPHVSTLSPIAKYGYVIGAMIASSLIMGIFFAIKITPALGISILLFTLTEPVIYIIPSVVLALILSTKKLKIKTNKQR